VRDFFVTIDKISVSFEVKCENVFVEFEFGGQSIEADTDDVTQKVVKKKVTMADGSVEERETVQPVYVKIIRVKKVPHFRYMSYMKKHVKAKSVEKYQYDRVEGYWRGSYSDLEKEQLKIRVWSAQFIGGNILIGEATESLIAIADSKVDRAVNVSRKGQSAREEVVCQVRFKCEFQEWFRFDIQFQNWSAEYTKPDEEAARIQETTCYTPMYKSQIEFQIPRSRAGALESLRNCFCPCLRTDWNYLPLGPGVVDFRTPPGAPAASVIYPGTLSWLEDEELQIRWAKSCCCGWCCCRTEIASTVMPMQGTLDYGYILKEVPVRQKACSAYHTCYSMKQCCFSLCSHARTCFGPSCNCGREGYSALGRPLTIAQRDKQRAEHMKYFVPMNLSGVITCGTFPRYRQQGSVDPAKKSGLLSFATTRDAATYLVVKVVRAQSLKSIDEFKETLNPYVVVEWGGIQKRTKTVPESVSPYWDYDVYFKIPDQGGAPQRLEDFAESVQNSKVVFTVWDESGLSRSVLGYAEIDFKTIFENRREMPVHIFSSDTKVPHLAYETRLALDYPFAQVADDIETRRQHKQLEAEEKYLEVLVYYDRVDNVAIDSKKSPEKEVATVTSAEISDRFSRARAFWNESLRYVSEKENRFFAFFGKDEYTGDFHFLPRFIKPMHPPANMKHLSEIFYYVTSIECVQKPPAIVDEVTRRRHIAQGDACSPIVHKDIWVWSDPYFFFEKKRGDLRDHAILLCNFLLGCGLPKHQFNVFVCIGTVLTTKGEPVPHTWVMTLEKFGEPVVRFWEIKYGQTFVLDGRRFDEVYDHATNMMRTEAIRLAKRESILSKVADGQGDAATSAAAAAAAGAAAEAEQDVDLPWDTVGNKIMEEIKAFNPEDDAALLAISQDNGLKGIPDSTNLNVYEAKTSAVVDHERAGARHRMQLLQQFAREEEQRFPHVKDRFWESYDNQGRPKPKKTPYASLEVVFNHECLFANLQQADPERIMYELDNKSRWIEFAKENWTECFKYETLYPFFKDRAIVSVLAPEREIEALRQDMLTRLRDAIRTMRSYQYQFETVFFEKFDFNGSVRDIDSADTYARLRFDIEVKHGMRDEGLRVFDSMLAENADEKKFLATSYSQEVKKLQSKIVDNLKQEVYYQERLLYFKHADPNRIGDQVRRLCGDLLETSDSVSPQFYVAVNIERLPGQICPVRVLLLLMTNPTRRTKK